MSKPKWCKRDGKCGIIEEYLGARFCDECDISAICEQCPDYRKEEYILKVRAADLPIKYVWEECKRKRTCYWSDSDVCEEASRTFLRPENCTYYRAL